METPIPEKAKLLCRLRECGFNVPDFIYVPAADFHRQDFSALEEFLSRHRESYKVIARSAHPVESHYKGGTFDSLETYADLAGIQYARKRMIKSVQDAKRLSILRQQTFEGAPPIDAEQMGVIVMPFVQGSNVMAKKLWDHWEFGYCRDRTHKVQSEPFITRTPHDRNLLQISQAIEDCLGFPCEIEFIISEDGQVHVVQAKDISRIDILEQQESLRSLELDGLRRTRKRRSYRERPVYVMDTEAFYLEVIGRCEDLVLDQQTPPTSIDPLLAVIRTHEHEMERFAIHNRRFAVLGIAIQPPEELHQIANHYLDDTPELQQQLTKALHRNQYLVDTFLAEADTLIAKNKIRLNLGSHDAYGINTVRNPIWSVYWLVENHERVVRRIRRLGFKSGDVVGIEVNTEGKPILYRL